MEDGLAKSVHFEIVKLDIKILEVMDSVKNLTKKDIHMTKLVGI